MLPTPRSPYEIAGLVALLASPVLLLALVGRVPAFRQRRRTEEDDEPHPTRPGGTVLAVGGALTACAGVAASGPYLAAAPLGLAVVVLGAAAFVSEPVAARRVRHAGLGILVLAGLLLPLLLDL